MHATPLGSMVRVTVASEQDTRLAGRRPKKAGQRRGKTTVDKTRSREGICRIRPDYLTACLISFQIRQYCLHHIYLVKHVYQWRRAFCWALYVRYKSAMDQTLQNKNGLTTAATANAMNATTPMS